MLVVGVQGSSAAAPSTIEHSGAVDCNGTEVGRTPSSFTSALRGSPARARTSLLS
jgi:hypothetical protein